MLMFFWGHDTLSCEFRGHRAGSQLKILLSLEQGGPQGMGPPTRLGEPFRPLPQLGAGDS